MNIMEGELHGAMNKDDPQDPTLSYGVQKNYRCYQINELEAAFNDHDGAFRFRVPDWNAPGPNKPTTIDPITGNPLVSDFSLESIQQLQLFLQNAPYNVEGLIQKIRQGLQAFNDIRRRVMTIRAQYNEMNTQQQYNVRLYLTWMFIYGMWMRFWKGEGHAWPTQFNKTDENLRCTTQDRDKHATIQRGSAKLLSRHLTLILYYNNGSIISLK
jgi:hypothetical protein